MPKPLARVPIRSANAAYEAWLRAQLSGEVIQRDLRKKREKMSSGALPFLRATYWRWAETVLEVCPELANAPAVLAVGDIHLENYGVWRDADGRLVWGVNDFDEAAEMPYVLDLVRLAASVALAHDRLPADFARMCSAIVDGYRDGLAHPRAFVLDAAHDFLRRQFAVPNKDRAKFWKKLEADRSKAAKPPLAMRRAIEGALPRGFTGLQFWPRTAGTGSLGRPRWVGHAEWCGGPVVREAKAVVTSGWSRLPGRGSRKIRCAEIANGRYRAPDPCYIERHRTLVMRRLSPNSRKLELAKHGDVLLSLEMLHLMGQDLANVHLGTGDPKRAVMRDLRRRPRGWLAAAARAAADFVRREHKEWRQASRA